MKIAPQNVRVSFFTFVLLKIFGPSNPKEVPLNLTIYYETLCPDSVRFIKTQLFPTWTLLGGAGNEFMHVEYIPYGHATTIFRNGVYDFECQHGMDECEGNKMHSCALKNIPEEFHGAFIDCSMSYYYPPYAGSFCSRKLNLNYTVIEECMNSSEGSELLASYGNKTHSLSPDITYIPWIIYNGNYSARDLSDSETNLMYIVCKKLANDTLPSFCK